MLFVLDCIFICSASDCVHSGIEYKLHKGSIYWRFDLLDCIVLYSCCNIIMSTPSLRNDATSQRFSLLCVQERFSPVVLISANKALSSFYISPEAQMKTKLTSQHPISFNSFFSLSPLLTLYIPKIFTSTLVIIVVQGFL